MQSEGFCYVSEGNEQNTQNGGKMVNLGAWGAEGKGFLIIIKHISLKLVRRRRKKKKNQG